MPTRRRVIGAGATLAVVGSLSGCSDFLSGDQEEFVFGDVTFVTEEPADVGEYEEQPDSTYALGEKVLLYLEVLNPPTNDEDNAQLHYVFSIDAPGDRRMGPYERDETWEDADNARTMISHGWETTEEEEPGDYEIDITVRDEVDDKEISTTATFTLEA